MDFLNFTTSVLREMNDSVYIKPKKKQSRKYAREIIWKRIFICVTIERLISIVSSVIRVLYLLGV